MVDVGFDAADAALACMFVAVHFAGEHDGTYSYDADVVVTSACDSKIAFDTGSLVPFFISPAHHRKLLYRQRRLTRLERER